MQEAHLRARVALQARDVAITVRVLEREGEPDETERGTHEWERDRGTDDHVGHNLQCRAYVERNA